MPRGKELRIEYQGQQMNLCEFARALGLSRRTVQDRWSRGERSAEELGRKARKYVRKSQRSCVSSLLVGWKLATGVSEQLTETGQSARSADLMDGDTNCGI